MRRPVTSCALCGASLLFQERYRVKLIPRKGPVKGKAVKVLHVCYSCLRKLKRSEEFRKDFKVRYRRMPPLRRKRVLPPWRS